MTQATAMALPARLTHAQAAKVAHQLQKTIMSAKEACVLDASALQQFDSSALAVLLAVCRAAAQQKKALQIFGLPKRAVQLAALYGVSEILVGHSSLPPSP
ncbi:MAG: lipid asymmetry maintenance protein MlaB [Limnohabitans sp.]